MKNIVCLTGIVLLSVAACAKNPDSIAPISMAPNAYSGLSCEEARYERQRLGAELATLENQQRSAVAGDAVGVFLIGVPMSSLTGGDKEGLIASSKGQIMALDSKLYSCRG